MLAVHLPPGGRIRVLSVTPSAVDATFVSRSGAESIAIVTPGLHIAVRGTGDRLREHRGILPRSLAAAGPARILRDAQRRFGLRPADFDRLELDLPSASNAAGWLAKWSQPTDDEGLISALDGRDLRRPFTPAAVP